MCRESCFLYKSDSMILIKNGFNPLNYRSPNSNLTIAVVAERLRRWTCNLVGFDRVDFSEND